MRIITKVYKAVGKFGVYEIKVTRIRGLRLRKLVPVLKKKCS